MTKRTLLIVGTKMAKSDPNWITSEQRVSIMAMRNSLFPPSRTRTRGWMIRDAWSEKLTLLDKPSIVWMARLRNAVKDSGLSTISCRSYDLTIIGMTRCKYSSIFAPKVKKASKTLIWVLIRFSVSSPSNTFRIRGRTEGRNGLNSASNAFPRASIKETMGSWRVTLSHNSLIRLKISGTWLRICCLIIPIRIANCCKWNSCNRAAEPVVTEAKAGMIYESLRLR